MSQKTWGGRFEGGTDQRVEAFSESISFDHRLYRHDIRASQAHARMLAATGLLSNEESTYIVQALNEIENTITSGEMEFSFGLEDIHTHIERALIDKLGDTGRKLHTARSRNDQIATDIKLWVRDTIDELCEMLAGLQSAFLESAQRQCDVIIPAYTHMQRAQPVLAGHYFLAYIEKFERDRERLMDCRKRVNVLPLARRHLLERHCRSTAKWSGKNSASTLWLAIVSTFPVIGTSSRNCSSICRWWRFTSADGPRSGFSGRRLSSIL